MYTNICTSLKKTTKKKKKSYCLRTKMRFIIKKKLNKKKQIFNLEKYLGKLTKHQRVKIGLIRIVNSFFILFNRYVGVLRAQLNTLVL